MPLTTAELIDDGAAVALTWDDGTRARFHAIWLRDNAGDPGTRSADNGQRLITVLDISADVRLKNAAVTGGNALDMHFAPGDLRTTYDADWLRERIYDHSIDEPQGWVSSGITLWDGTFQDRVPSVRYHDATTNASMLAGWLRTVEQYGFAVMTGCPVESGDLLKVTGLFGFVRETNYGKWFDVRAEVNPNNLAYTNLGLQAHTDNPYRDPVPTLQILACLENTVEGGESMVVDGFAVARRVREENPGWFDLLAGHPARFSYDGSAGTCLQSKRPMIELGPDGEMIAIRFNNRSAAAFTDVPYDDMTDYYAAYRRFAELVEDPAMAVTFKLAPGETFIVDNTRVLHARTAFSGTGQRWLQGCYADKDGLRSTRKSLETQLREAAA
ncbi:MAG: 2-trimethylaminoethylphosphonate dioxygenase [Hyphomicrobiaceae bacterium]